MVATSTTENWDALWTLTARAKRKRLTDNISDAYPTIDAFRKNNMLETEPGGKQIQEDLMYALQDPQWFDSYDVLQTSRLDGITAAFYDWAYLASNISIAMTEEKENRASDKAIKLLEAKTRQAMQGALDGANAALHASAADLSKAPIGLQDICPNSGTVNSGVLGGVDRATNTWWRNAQVDGNVGGRNNVLTTQTKTNIFNYALFLSELYVLVAEGNDTPDLIITSQANLADWETIFESTGYLRTTTNGKQGIDGRNATYKGIPFIGDADCTADATYMLNSKYLKFKIQQGMNFSKTPFQAGQNQLAKSAFIVLGCQLTTNHLARQGLIHDTAN
tara:strand:- start:4783 stop:5787 length:1005 start_codon:yes stop_codon:yes gene_type:complete